MVETLESRPGIGFWGMGAFALIWNLFGLMIYIDQVSLTPETIAAQFTPEQAALISQTPVWVTSMTAIATNAGVVASVMLLLRFRWCVPLFAVSLAAIVLQDFFIFGMSDSLNVFGVQVAVIQGLVFVFALLFLWYAMRTKQKGWLR